MSYAPESAEVVRAFIEAHDIAQRAAQPLSTAHVLLAVFTFPNRAQLLLTEHQITEDSVLAEVRVMEEERVTVVHSLRRRAAELASKSGGTDVNCLHVLLALTRMQHTFGYRLLQRTGTSVGSLRSIAFSYVMGNMPRRYRQLQHEAPEAEPLFARGRGEPGLANVAPAPRAAPTVGRAEPPAVGEREEPPPRRASSVDETPSEPQHEDCEPEPPATPTAPPSRAQPAAAADPSGPLHEMAPTLAHHAQDMLARARAGRLDEVIGREQELDALVDILGKRRANNPVLVGPPGVGKTAIVEGLAIKIARGDPDVAHLRDRLLVSLDTGALVAGTSLRGSFSERLGAIKSEIAAAKGRIVVFIDEVHTLIGAGSSSDGPQDAATELKTALARGEFPCIGATTIDEYRKYIEKDPALERRFTPIDVTEPSPDDALLILDGAVKPYAEHHGVRFGDDALGAAVQLSHRFVAERKLPDKAFAVLDLAGSRARRMGKRDVGRMEVAQVVHEWTAVPLERLAEADGERLGQAEEILGSKIIGHRDVVKAVCRQIRRGYAGFNGRRPMGSFLFLGPTGVGKTEMVKVMAEFLFGRSDAIVRIDMSELSEKHSVARLIGAQPGYVGFEEGGQLTEALRKRPFQIVLFDEVDKAHPDVLNLLLQILDEGHLSDSKGRRISFANTLVVLTSNQGASSCGSGRSIGFGAEDDASAPSDDTVLESARAQLAPELWARLDERLAFGALSRSQVREVAALQLRSSSRALFAERNISLEWTPSLLDFLLDNGGYSSTTGARGMRQCIQRFVEAPVAEKVLAGEVAAGDILRLSASGGGGVRIRKLEEARRRRGVDAAASG